MVVPVCQKEDSRVHSNFRALSSAQKIFRAIAPRTVRDVIPLWKATSICEDPPSTHIIIICLSWFRQML
ncbi:hypothetical protein ILYODFUR_021839 [Ilyodon furcidens]|uniref:Uncharacterized protein n=1 Tax=Ilyodon furcidens TaxID=33524 RepID=A0ABV0UIM7_9TELE